MGRVRFFPLALVFGLLLGSPSAAQFLSYRAPGPFEPERETREAQFERAMREARWKLGRFYLDPSIGLSNLSAQDNIGGFTSGRDAVSDVTASIQAGVRGWLPIGSDLTFALHALPEYVWWRDLDGRSRLNGTYGSGIFGNLGRTGLELTAQRIEDSRFFSNQLEEPVNTREDRAGARLEIDLWGGVAVFGEAELGRLRFLDRQTAGLPAVEALDRDESLLRAGLQLALSDAWSVGVGVERTVAEFEPRADGIDLDNSGDSPFVSLRYQRGDVYFLAKAADRSLTAEAGSVFPPYEEVTGQIELAYQLLRPIELQLFARRGPVLALGSDYPYFEDTAQGASVRLSLGKSVNLQLSHEEGTNEYRVLGPGVPARSDDRQVSGAGILIRIGRSFLQLGYRRIEYDSSLPQFDRTVNQFVSGLTFGRQATPWG